jgi:DNA-binding GntR family transcriptional regulator
MAIKLATKVSNASLLNNLLDLIVSGQLSPGTPLRQEEVAEQFSVSRMPVREAFSKLEAMGLLQVVPNSGAFVAELNHAEFRENFEMRAAAECLALRISIPELNNRQLDEATALHQSIMRCDRDEYSKLNNKFHMRLYSPCRRPRLLDHIETLNIVAERYIKVTIDKFEYSDRSNSEHEQILDACKKRNVQLSVDLLYDHITTAGEHLEAAFFKKA